MKPWPTARKLSGAAKIAGSDSRGVRRGAITAVERDENVVLGGSSGIQSPGPGSGDVLEDQVGSESTQELLLPLVDRLAADA
jgi:hypothetical protein